MSLSLPRLPDDPDAPFPDPADALRRPDGLLAVGGDLTPTRLLNAYRHGIFPWYSKGQPLLWWSPDPRMVFRTDAIHLSRRFRRSLRASRWVVRADTMFDVVVARCAATPRPGQDGTWITPAMRRAYSDLHHLGYAHSVEVFEGPDADADLVGGIYGVAVGRMFFGESMFSAVAGGSKAALAFLADHLHGQGWPLLDAQVENPHLLRLGAQRMPRECFLARIGPLVEAPGHPGSWTAWFGGNAAARLAG